MLSTAALLMNSLAVMTPAYLFRGSATGRPTVLTVRMKKTAVKIFSVCSSTDFNKLFSEVERFTCNTGEFYCGYQKCIKMEFKCDDDNDCGDWSDEDDCERHADNCGDGEFR